MVFIFPRPGNGSCVLLDCKTFDEAIRVIQRTKIRQGKAGVDVSAVEKITSNQLMRFCDSYGLSPYETEFLFRLRKAGSQDSVNVLDNRYSKNYRKLKSRDCKVANHLLLLNKNILVYGANFVWDLSTSELQFAANFLSMSRTGDAWEDHLVTGLDDSIKSIGTDGQQIIGIAGSRLFQSRDGIHFHRLDSPSKVTDIAIGNSLIACIDENGQVVFTRDFQAWNSAAPPFGVASIEFHHDRFFVYDGRRQVGFSEDLIQWKTIHLKDSTSLVRIRTDEANFYLDTRYFPYRSEFQERYEPGLERMETIKVTMENHETQILPGSDADLDGSFSFENQSFKIEDGEVFIRTPGLDWRKIWSGH